MKKSLLLIIVLALVYAVSFESQLLEPTPATSQHALDTSVHAAFENKQSDVQVKGIGKVIRLLPDDNDGSRHQKFILKLKPAHTVLIAHNIDLAPRINNLNKGDTVEFFGEYEWNAKGGVIHWTHHDPKKNHADGWLKHKGRIYQ